jgi:hypothetical protein
VIATLPSFHGGVALSQDGSQFPELWDGLKWGWSPWSQDGTGKLFGLVGGVDRTFTSVASSDWKVDEGGLLTPLYDGTADTDVTAAAIDLSPYNQLTLSIWFQVVVADGTLDMVVESGTRYFDTNGFAFFPRDVVDGNIAIAAVGGNPTGAFASFTQPSLAVWHHALVGFDKGAAASTPIAWVYIDAASQTLSQTGNFGAAGNFSSQVVNFGSRNGASFFSNCRIGEVLLYPGFLPSADRAGAIAEVFCQGGSPFQPRPKLHTVYLGTTSPPPPPPSSFSHLLLLGVG